MELYQLLQSQVCRQIVQLVTGLDQSYDIYAAVISMILQGEKEKTNSCLQESINFNNHYQWTP